MARLKGKVVLVTGGGSGIGLASARLLHEEGASVAITGRSAAKLEAAARELGGEVFTHAADLADAVEAVELVEAVTGQFGPIDVLVANAGANIKERQFKELTPDSWEGLLDANLNAAFHSTHAVLPGMRKRGQGQVIYVNSISGLRANPLGGVGYIAAKFALRGMALGVAAEEKSSGVRFTSIYPGEVNTPILENRPEPVSQERKVAMLQPEDVAQAVLFVVSLPPRANVPELIITPANAVFI
ncbi:MAG: SDR family oxidoreductase [Gemmataceae bacterium]|nr:SDR family oxidoreductase [Gemmataceae bacterium]